MSNFEEDLAIDPHELDEECMRQAMLFEQYAKKAARLRKVRDEAFTERKRVKSRLTAEALEDPSLIPGGKATTVPLEAYYRNHVEYQGAENKYIEANYNLEMAETDVRAFSQRKNMLNELVKLHAMSYFAVVRKDTQVKPGKRIIDRQREQAGQTARKTTREKVKKARRRK